MATLFNQVKDKLTQVGQGAVKGTKHFTETTRLNSQLSEESRTQDELFRQIGEKYFELYPNSADANFSDYCAELHESIDKVRSYQRQLAMIRGKVICGNCGSEMSTSAAFCSACGAKLVLPQAEQETQTVDYCRKCGSPLAAGEGFCTKCGANVDGEPEKAVPSTEEGMAVALKDIPETTEDAGEAEAAAEEAAEQAEPQTRRCPHCGAEVAEDKFFCTSCGSKLS